MSGLGLEEIVVMVVFSLIRISFQVFLIVLGVVIAWRWLHRPGGLAATTPRSPDKSAFEILDERYARGEIDEREYNERQALLMRQYRQTL